ncbi:MAG: hypothetical protein C4539_06450 [Ignavibacteriales bacterium]|nr:MAG: hypothetical protein C4539_06450 [Ignavibacteriales bacterium]
MKGSFARVYFWVLLLLITGLFLLIGNMDFGSNSKVRTGSIPVSISKDSLAQKNSDTLRTKVASEFSGSGNL